MNLATSPVPSFRRLGRFVLLALSGCLLLPVGRADTMNVKSKGKGPVKNLARFFPAPTGNSGGSPDLLVVPLLGPGRVLLPGGKLIVWVGRNDGTPHAFASVVIRVPDLENGNTLARAGQRVLEVTLVTDANGLAEIFLAAPEVPKPNDGPGDGGGGGEA